MKILLAFLLFAVPCISFCQFNSAFEISLGGFSRNHTVYAEDPEVHELLKHDSGDRHKLNWSFGIHYNKRLSSTLYFKTGIQLLSMGYKSHRLNGLQWGDQVGPDFRWIPIPSRDPAAAQFIASNNHLFLAIPLLLHYEWKNKKITPFIEGGLAPSLYMSTHSKREGPTIGLPTYPFPGFNKFQLAASLSAGIVYTLNTRVQLLGQPVFRYHISHKDRGSIKEHLYGMGIEFGMRRILK